jgi:hypothetical protein
MATFPEYMRRPPVIVRVRVTRSVVVLCVVFWILCCEDLQLCDNSNLPYKGEAILHNIETYD